MKKLIRLSVLLLALFSGFSIEVMAQSIPHTFNYSAVARDSDGNAMSNSVIGVQLTLRMGEPDGDIIYQENHLVSTDQNGLFALLIGNGEVITGEMNTINWGSSEHFLEVGMDPNGGTNFLTMGTTQLVSVPYALHAKTAESIIGQPSEDDLYIGQEYLGGIICHLYRDSDGEQHGLVISKAEAILAWDLNFNATMGRDAWDGEANTNLMSSDSPIVQWLEELGPGWYLPAIAEMNHAWLNGRKVNQTLLNGGYTLIESDYYSLAQYWTSTEVNASSARYFFTDDGDGNLGSKNTQLKVRAMKRF